MNWGHPVRLGRGGVFGFAHQVKHLFIRSLARGRPFLIRVGGVRMYIYPNTYETCAYLCRPFEPTTTKFFKQAVKPGATVLDIGAQFGYFSLEAMKRAGPEGKVYAFEPAPANFELLERNIQINEYVSKIQAVQKAVGEKPQSVPLFLYEGSDSHGMYPAPQGSVRDTLSIDCITVDDFLQGETVDVIKMDIEGNESHALQGMRQTITNSEDLTLFIEFAPAYLHRAGTEPTEFLAELEGLGFHLQLIDEEEGCLKPVVPDLVQKSDPSWYANLYCTKKRLVDHG